MASLALLLALAPVAEAAPAVRYQSKSRLLRLLHGGTAPAILSVQLPSHQGEALSPIPPTPPRTRFRRWVYQRKGVVRALRRSILGGSATRLELAGAGFVAELTPGATYNVTLSGDELLLAETGSGFFRDLASRHALLTDYQPSDFGATLRRLEDDTLELANWSGTFMTPSARLGPVAERMRSGLGVERIVTRAVDKAGVMAASPSPSRP